MKALTYFLLLFPNYNLNANCIKQVSVKETVKEFTASLPFPKITEHSYIKNLQIKCELYNRISEGDTLYLDDIKDFVLTKGFSPHGKIKRINYLVLKK